MSLDPNVSLSKVAWEHVPSTYIVCTEDKSIFPEMQREWAKERATDVIEVPFDHVPGVSHPEEMADILARIASSV